MCPILYISIWRIEKNLANKIIKMSLVGSIGSMESGPNLYQALTPRISGAKKKRPINAKRQKK